MFSVYQIIKTQNNTYIVQKIIQCTTKCDFNAIVRNIIVEFYTRYCIAMYQKHSD